MIASERLSSAIRRKPNGRRRMPGMPKSPILGGLVITGRPNALANSVTKAPNKRTLWHMEQIHFPFELEEDSRQAEGKQQEPRRIELDPLHPMNRNAVDQFHIVLSRAKTA